MNYLIVFVLFFIVTFVSARRIISCAEYKPFDASFFSSLYYVLHTVCIVYAVNDPWCILSLAAGAFFGTGICVTMKRRRAVGEEELTLFEMGPQQNGTLDTLDRF